MRSASATSAAATTTSIRTQASAGPTTPDLTPVLVGTRSVAKKTKMPTDVNQRAARIVDLATSDEELPERDEARAKGGKKGGQARTRNLTSEQRSEIARKAASARWAKD